MLVDRGTVAAVQETSSDTILNLISIAGEGDTVGDNGLDSRGIVIAGTGFGDDDAVCRTGEQAGSEAVWILC